MLQTDMQQSFTYTQIRTLSISEVRCAVYNNLFYKTAMPGALRQTDAHIIICPFNLHF